MTQGTNNCIKCPYCRQPMYGVAEGRQIAPGQIQEYEYPCQYCGKRIYIWARMEITLQAERMEKVK